MKIIHTSDWHLGQEFYSYNRSEEHEAFLAQLYEIVRQEQPDVMVVSGDIYHNATPSNTVMRLFNERLEKICSACSTMQVVVTAGNHDSSSRLEINRSLWSHLNVAIVGHVEKGNDRILFDRHILGVRNREGELCGYVVALPHVFPQNFPLVNPDTPREQRQEAFFEALGRRLAEVNTDGLPVVMMAHMALAGSDITGHDSSRGGLDYTDVATLKVDYDYLALGHIHCPQYIGSKHVRYCGSPIPVSFDEHYPHSVTVVDIPSHGAEPQVKTIDIVNPWPLETLPKDAVEFEEALNLLSEFPNNRKAYIRLHVKLPDVPPCNAMARAMEMLAGKEARFCTFKWVRESDEPTQSRTFGDVEEIRQKSPVDIAELYYLNKFGHPMEQELKDMLAEVVEEVEISRN